MEFDEELPRLNRRFITPFLTNPVLKGPIEETYRCLAKVLCLRKHEPLPKHLRTPIGYACFNIVKEIGAEEASLGDTASAYDYPAFFEASIPTEVHKISEESIRDAWKLSVDESRVMSNVNPSLNLTSLTDSYPDTVPIEVSDAYSASEMWSIPLRRLAQALYNGNRRAVRIEFGNTLFVMCESVNFVRVYLNGKVIRRFLTYDQATMIKDAMLTRYQVIAAAYMSPGYVGLLPAIRAQWKWQSTCVKRYGNKGYEIAKSTEALAKVWASELAGDIFAGPDSPRIRMEKKMDKKRREDS